MPIKENPKKDLISKSVTNHHHHLLQLLIFTLFLSEKGPNLNSSKKYAFLYFISPNSKKLPDSILDTKTLLLHPTN